MRNEKQTKQLTRVIYDWINQNKPDHLPAFLGSISKVYLANNNHFAKISIAMDQGDDWVDFLNESKHLVKHFVAKQLNWRKTPTIVFELDADDTREKMLQTILDEHQ